MDVFSRYNEDTTFRLENTAVTKLDLFFYDEYMTSGTGFVYAFGQDLYLVSNWHVFSGMHPITKLTRDSRGYKPNKIKFHVSVFSNEDTTVYFRPVEMDIRDGDEVKWLGHKGYTDENGDDQIVDVAVLPLSNFAEDYEEVRSRIGSFPAQVLISGQSIAESEDDSYPGEALQHAYPRVASDVFVLGFPKGIPTQGAIPVWKRGSIATEPLFGALDGAPIILIDALTRDGMSGSPVIHLDGQLVTKNGTIMATDLDRREPWLVGVYAGREGVTRNEVDMALGRVWRKECIDEILMPAT